MNEIYLDNSSTTKPSKAVVDIVLKTMTEDYGNPSSMHRKGLEAEQYIKKAREAIASSMKVTPQEIVFTSGGTESDNTALFGAAMAGRRRGRRVLVSAMEHPAVLEPAAMLEKEGFSVGYIGVDREGRIDMTELERELTEDVILVSTMYVNNEIGSVVPVQDVSRLIKARSPHALYHVDAIQAFGKYRIYPKQLGIDLLSVSGHKIHGPKGTGFLYVSRDVRIVPYIYGGGQQSGMRSGTENVPGVAGLGIAVSEAYTDFDSKVAKMRALKDRLTAGLTAMEGVTINGMSGSEGAPHIVNASFAGIGSEVMLHSLEDRGIYVSAGSACSTHKRNASPTMTAIGAPKEESSSAIRFSFCESNTEEEVDTVLAALGELVPMLMRYRRR